MVQFKIVDFRNESVWKRVELIPYIRDFNQLTTKQIPIGWHDIATGLFHPETFNLSNKWRCVHGRAINVSVGSFQISSQ